MRIHFIGICGYAVSGLALVAKQLGNDVTGSDEDAYPPTTDILTNAGIKWVDGHTAGNGVAGGTTVSLLKGDGHGNFGPPTAVSTGVNPIAVAIADVNGDGRADVAVANYSSTTSALGKFFCDDHTHFEAAGAAQIAAVVAKALRDQNIPLAAYLK